MHEKIQNIVESSFFQNFIIGVIVFNGITMGLETSKDVMSSYGTIIKAIDFIVISIFVVEITMRLYVYRFPFFKSGWNVFDFTIVAISLIPSSAGFEILRILRVFRLFRLVTVVPQMRKIVIALVSVIPGMASIGALLILIFYIFAIMAVQLFGDSFPHWFGTLGESFYTLFQIMTLESWSMGIVRPIMEVHPYAWVYFVPFIFIVTFIMINLIIAIVVDAMNEIKDQEQETIVGEIHTSEDHTKAEVEKLRVEIAELKEILLEQKRSKP
jgi:voltage-gated sodium channel